MPLQPPFSWALLNPYECKSKVLLTKHQSQAQTHMSVQGLAGALRVQCSTLLFSCEEGRLLCSLRGLIPYLHVPLCLGRTKRDRNHLRSPSVQQTPTAGAKDQFCGGLCRPLEQALQRVKVILGTPQPGCYFLIHWSFFREAGLLNSRN